MFSMVLSFLTLFRLIFLTSKSELYISFLNHNFLQGSIPDKVVPVTQQYSFFESRFFNYDIDSEL